MRIRVGRRRPSNEPHNAGAGLPRTPSRASSPLVKERITRLVVEVGNRASAWRQAAVDAELAYRWWKSAVDVDRGKAAAAYLAAIEREEKAANEYSRALETCSSATP
jgi:hypothetical protein